VFSCVKGNQRNVEYFQTNLDFGEVAQLVELPEDFLGDELFDQELTMQRKLSWTRVRKEMVPYLERGDAFYSALTLIMIPRDLEKLEEGEGYEFVPLGGNGGEIGKLTVKSTLVLFPADGQHRVASIKEVLKKNPKLANVSVPVIFLPFRSRGEVRQLFSDLNLNAKPVNKSIGRSFETRDPIAVITKQLEKLVPLFTGRVNHLSNSLPASSDNVISTKEPDRSCAVLVTM
jgi:DGQHR domain-containing protein